MYRDELTETVGNFVSAAIQLMSIAERDGLPPRYFARLLVKASFKMLHGQTQNPPLHHAVKLTNMVWRKKRGIS